ncbi:MAG: hypothetical protein IT165_31650 [Bryobacterales bacterium]|nr:hypothetical protein [Bryobacterales bacterium]
MSVFKLAAAAAVTAGCVFAQTAAPLPLIRDSKPRVEASAPVDWRIVTRPTTGGALISLKLRNRGAAPSRLGKVYLVDGWLDLPTQAVALSMSGWQIPSLVKPVKERVTSQVMMEVVAGSRAANLGFVTFDRIYTEHAVWPEAGRLRVQSWCDFRQWALPPGQEVTTEELRVAPTGDGLRGLEEWANAVASQNHPRIWREPVAGWVGWSWVDPFHSERYEDVVRRNAQAIRERLSGFPIHYIWVSLGNLEGRQAGNWLAWNRQAFPTPPEKLVQDLNAAGFKLGLWAGAFWLSAQLEDKVARLNDALLRKDGQLLFVPHREIGKVYILDPTHPKTHEWLRETFSTYRRWGVRYFMIDFLDSISDVITGRYMPTQYAGSSLIPGPQTFRRGIEVVRKAAGPDTYLLASTGPTLHSMGIMDGVRAGSDYGEGRVLDGPGKGFYPGTFVINKADYWTSHRRATEAWASHYFMNGKLFVADTGNVLSVDQPIAVSGAQISATIFGLNASPLMLGDDIARIAPSRLEILRKVFPRGGNSAVPVDLFESPSPDYPKVFRLDVAKSWDNWQVAAVFNFGREVLKRRLSFTGKQAVWDFWNERSLGVHDGGIDIDVLPESVRVVRLSRERDHPWLQSTDMHVRQGEMEIEEVAWDAGASTLRFTAVRPSGYKGAVFLRAPAGWAAAEPAGLWIARDGSDNSLTIRVNIEFGPTGRVTKSIRFQRFHQY